MMGRDLTKRHVRLFETDGIRGGPAFFRDAYRSGKLRELASFVIWEALHRTNLFPRSKYLKFTESAPLMLTNELIAGDAFHEKISRFFTERGFSITRSAHDWRHLFINRR